MKRLILLACAVLLLGTTEARAERLSVASVKATVAAVKVVAKSAKPCAVKAWRGLGSGLSSKKTTCLRGQDGADYS